VDDCKNLSDHEALIRRISATAQNQFVEFTEKKLLYHRFIRFPELADPCVQNTVRDSKPLGYIDNRVALVDDLFDCLVFELGGIF
jgi:hypothetical protein